MEKNMRASSYWGHLERLGWCGRGILWAVLALAGPAWAGWESGNFQKLPTLSVTELANFVADARQMPHPTRGYAVPSTTRSASFNALLDAVFSAIDTMLAGFPYGAKPWCDVVQHKAPSAHYAIMRLWEQASQRYFIYLHDTSTAGPQEVHVIINPE